MSHARKLRSGVFLDPDHRNGQMIHYYKIIKVQKHPVELAKMTGDSKKGGLVGLFVDGRRVKSKYKLRNYIQWMRTPLYRSWEKERDT